MSHLVLLAPANFGCPVARKGRAFYDRLIKGLAKRQQGAGLTGLSMTSRPWNLRPDGPKTGQKFADDLAQEMGAPHEVRNSLTIWPKKRGPFTLAS